MAADPFQTTVQGITPPLSTAPPPPPPPPPTTGQTSEAVPDGGTVVASGGHSRKGWKGNKKIIATILGILFLVGGVGAGIALIGQRQDIREKAQQAVCTTDADCSIGQVCSSSLTCVTAPEPVTQTAGCPFTSIEARVHREFEEPWNTSIQGFTCGENFEVGLFANAFGTFVDDSSLLGGDARTPKITISGAGVDQVVNQNKAVFITTASSTSQTITYTGEILAPDGSAYQEAACRTQITFSCSASSSAPPTDNTPEETAPPVGGAIPTSSPTSSPTASPTTVPTSTSVPTAPPDLPESGVGTPAILGISLGGIMLLVSLALAL